MRIPFVVALLAGLAVGLFVPDTDRVFPFLLHRSILTHSALIPLALMLYRREHGAAWTRMAVAGLAIGIAVHLSFDLFPSLWRGFALLSVPFYGRLGGTLSVLVMAASVVGCLWIALRTLAGPAYLLLAVGASVGGFWLVAPGEAVFWLALFLLLGSWLVAACFPNPVIHGQTVLRQFRQRVV